MTQKKRMRQLRRLRTRKLAWCQRQKGQLEGQEAETRKGKRVLPKLLMRAGKFRCSLLMPRILIIDQPLPADPQSRTVTILGARSRDNADAALSSDLARRVMVVAAPLPESPANSW
jgi:hypothetical protein